MRDIEPTSEENNSKKFEFESQLALVNIQPQVRCPDFLLISSQGKDQKHNRKVQDLITFHGA